MRSTTLICLLAIALSTVGLSGASAQDAPPQDDLRLDAPAGWSGEQIALPPAFARDMQLKGIEVIRFAPGMFDAKSASFFSYVLVFRVASEPELNQEVLHREILAYYRGLSKAVLNGRNSDLAPPDFTLQLTATKSQTEVPRPPGMTSFHGELKWLEPFVTRQPQTLQLDFETWQDVEAKHRYLLIMASPQADTAPIWTTMRKIRASFHNARNGR